MPRTPPTPTVVTPAVLLARLVACAPRSPFARAFLECVAPGDRLGCLTVLLGPEPVALVAVAARRPVFDDAQVLPGEGLFLLYDGVVEEWQSQFRLSVRRPGELLGELPALAERRHRGGGQPNAAVARDDCRLLPLRGAALRAAMDGHPGLVRAVLQAVAEHARDLADDEGQIVEALDEFFPRGFGQLTPGPYDCRDVTIHLFPFVMPEAPDHPMQVSRPPGVSWLSPFFFVALVKMRDTAHPAFAQTFNYDEVTFFVPSAVEGLKTPSLHIPFIYADNIMAILLGRELAGMPKLQVSTFIEPLDGPPDGPGVSAEDTTREPWRLLARRTDRIELELRFRQADTNTPRDATVSPKSLWERLTSGPSLALETAAELWSQLVDLLDAPPAGALALPLWMGFDTVRTTAWQRIFNPETRYTSASGARMAAGPGDFRLDALTETRFKVGQVFDVTPLTLEPNPDACYVADSFPLHGCLPLSPRGLRLHLKMQMIGGPVLLDYLDDPRWARDPGRSWGPWVRLRPPGVTGRT